MQQREQLACDFMNPTDLRCTTSYQTLTNQPFRFAWGDKLCVVVSAWNKHGEGPVSAEVCSDIARKPDPPIRVRDDEARRNI